MQNKIFILTGSQGSGKTSFLIELINYLKKEGVSIGGFIAHGFWKDDIRDKFELENIQTGDRIILSQTEPVEGWEKFRRFYFNPEGFEFGGKVLSLEKLKNTDLIVIDEIGPFELQGNGWRKAINKLLKETNTPMIWVCRESILKELITEFKLQSCRKFNILQDVPEKVARKIIFIIQNY